ncbi:MAG: hypothetical protein RI897_2379 [Verrucomicrobiota bacterium]
MVVTGISIKISRKFFGLASAVSGRGAADVGQKRHSPLTLGWRAPSLSPVVMAETNSNSPEGAVPPKPAEAAKVQPKKETVRITLPPKPTAAPTIKIPAPAIAAATAKAPAAPAAAPAAAAPAAAAPAAAPAARAGAAPAPRPAMAPRPAVAAVSGLDKGLAIAAVVLSVAVVVRLVLITMAP